MFYKPEDGHGLPHNPFSAIITPRPIGWISSRSAEGIDNLAPYSFFNGIANTPPQLMFASTDWKDSVRNIQETGVFCVNIVEEAYPSEPGLTTCWVCGCHRQDVRLMFCHAQPLEIRPPDVPRRLRGALSR